MVNKKPDNNTEQRILEAAKTILFKDGIQGARMQDIADLAKINRAMLHYYYRDKESLSEYVMKTVVSKFVETFKENLNSDVSIEEKIDLYISQEIDLVYNNSELTIFALHESIRDIDFFKKIIPEHKKSTLFATQLSKAIEEGLIKPFTLEEFIVFVSSLCMFPFLAGPLYKAILHWDEKRWQIYRRYLRRKLPELIKRAIYNK